MTATTAPHHDDVHVAVTLTSAGAGSLSMGGAVRPVRGVDLDDARDRVKRIVTARAAEVAPAHAGINLDSRRPSAQSTRRPRTRGD